MSESDGASSGPHDDESKRLKLASEKARYRQAIAEAQKAESEASNASVQSIIPILQDAAQGEVILGENAGALGPWSAHRLLGEIAAEIVTAVAKQLNPTGAPLSDAPPQGNHTKPTTAELQPGVAAAPTPVAPRVLVTNQLGLLQGDLVARQVDATLERMKTRLAHLKVDISSKSAELHKAIGNCQDSEKAAGVHPPFWDEDAEEGTMMGGDERPQPATPATQATFPNFAGGMLATSVNLLAYLRTDYSVNAIGVTPGVSELVVLVAGALAGKTIATELESTSTAAQSSALTKFANVVKERDEVMRLLGEFKATMAPVTAELTTFQTTATALEKAWIESFSKAEINPQKIKGALDELQPKIQRRSLAINPASTFVSRGQAELEEIDSGLAKLTESDTNGGEPPLLSAARWGRLNVTITHLLYVNTESLAADVVTRKSVLGTSGLLKYVSSGNATWLLLDVASQNVQVGGAAERNDVVTFSMESGIVGDHEERKQADRRSKDPLLEMESYARYLVIALIIVFVGLSLLALFGVVQRVIG